MTFCRTVLTFIGTGRQRQNTKTERKLKTQNTQSLTHSFTTEDNRFAETKFVNFSWKLRVVNYLGVLVSVPELGVANVIHQNKEDQDPVEKIVYST